MFVTPTERPANMNPMAIILAALGQPPGFTEIETGLILSGTWSADQIVLERVENYPDDIAPEGESPYSYGPYGVCDSPEQAMLRFRHLADWNRKFFISCVRVDRGSQPRDGGWRWHKWGEYIGLRQPTMEYLHDEPEIETVYTFRVYEIV